MRDGGKEVSTGLLTIDTEMFDGMNSMEILVLGTDFNVLDGTNMFKGCNNLTTIITKKNISSENAATLYI